MCRLPLLMGLDSGDFCSIQLRSCLLINRHMRQECFASLSLPNKFESTKQVFRFLPIIIMLG
jgi:hypothetical protein